MIETFSAELPSGVTLSCRASGRRGAPVLMFLHGFPEAAFVWDAMLEHFGERYRCIAPNLRGFEKSSAPAEPEAYRVKHLTSDLDALIAQVVTPAGGPLEALIAHDWGGAVAWTFAVQRPQMLKRLVIINSPHPATFLRELRDNPAQQAASGYMNFLCRPDAAALLAENDFERLWALFSNGGGAAWLSDSLRAQYRALWQQGLDGPLNYYRASPMRPPLSAADPIHTLVLPPEFVTVRVPTTVLWGEADTAFALAVLDGLDAYVERLDVQRVAGASHWIVHEQPALVAGAIARLLRPRRSVP